MTDLHARLAAQERARQSQLERFPPLETPAEKLAALRGDYEGESAEGREWLARHPLSAARGILNGLLIALVVIAAFAGLYLVTP